MFIRKLFKVGDKVKWLALELIVVFIGVYLAFLFQTYNEKEKDRREMEKVFSSLKYELESFRILLPGRAGHARGQVRDWLKKYQEGEVENFSLWRFLPPQYDYQIIAYAIGLENNNIIDFELYDNLQSLYSAIQKLESAERMLTEVAQTYQAIPQGLNKNSDAYKLRHADNLLNFRRFIRFTSDRAGDLHLVAKESTACLEIINELMDAETRRKIESQLIVDYIDNFGQTEDMVSDLKKYFPDFSEDEIREFLK